MVAAVGADEGVPLCVGAAGPEGDGAEVDDDGAEEGDGALDVDDALEGDGALRDGDALEDDAVDDDDALDAEDGALADDGAAGALVERVERRTGAGAGPADDADAAVVGTPAREAPETGAADAAGRAADRVGAGTAAARRASAVAVARARRRRSRPDGAGALLGSEEPAGTGREASVAAEGVRPPVTADDARPDPPSFPGRAGGSAVRAATCERMTRESELIVILPLARTSSETRTGIVWGARRCVEPPGRYVDWSGTRSSIRGRPRRAGASGTSSWVDRTADTSDHQRGGATFAGPVPTEIEAAGPTRERRTATERPQPSENRADDDATEPMRAGRRCPSTGPGRRMRTPMERPSRVRGSSSDDVGAMLTGSSPGTRCARPRASRTGCWPCRR